MNPASLNAAGFLALTWASSQVLFIPRASAVNFDGNIRTGVYSSQISIADDTSGNGINNQQIISSRFHLDVSEISRNDKVSIDIRDKYDFFGAIDSELLQLESKNTILVRELVYKKPWYNNPLYFSLGRFSLPEANILANDGAEIGYRFNRNNRLSLFGGLADKSIYLPREISEDPEGFDKTQFGLFWYFEDTSPEMGDSIRVTNAIAKAPTVSLLNASSRLYYHHYGLWLLEGDNRLTSFVDIDLTPNMNLRKLILSYSLLGNRSQFFANITRLHQDDFRLKREIRYELPASKLNLLSSRFIYRHTRDVSSEFVGDVQNRVSDSLNSFDLGYGLRLKDIFTRTSAIGFLAGYRSHFLSNDMYFKARFDHYQEKFGVHLSNIYRTESYKNGDKLNPLTFNGELSFNLSPSLRGSGALSYTTDEKVDILSFYLALGYNFKGQTSSFRQEPAEFERI